MLPYGRQTLTEADIAAVVAVLRSDFLTQGPQIEAFERRFAERVGARHAIAVNSATAALHLALRVAKVGAGDRVVTSPITFLASANAAAYVGATPDFADIDPVSYTLSPAALADGWREDTRAVVAVDYAGQAADLPEIARIARARGAVVIDDACHAVGGAFHTDAALGRAWSLGGNPWADLTTFSFHPVKTLTTGEGGMLVTDRDDWAALARSLRSHGIVREPDRFTPPSTDNPLLGERGPWFYEMQELGWNYRLTDLQCALGLSQLERLEVALARRREIVAAYNAAFADLPGLTTPALRQPADIATTSWHLYTVQIDYAALGRPRTAVMAQLRSAGVGSQVLYIPVYLQPWYRRTYGYAPGKCREAEAFYSRTLSLPLYASMTDADICKVIDAIRRIFLNA
ncbi:MAG: UDP-4-amino-4,6-dideoxy-N-acetyl-beta-L-altrosamine transaminase [Opitutus sp.]|nr:UDP-4-amino-4,6-dideoxy-N-acetyl-beta-L-altrosamine transaminase [Opitutus sp.]MCS6248378.1 UDP-4-amino-4,6-dideoxy-N-acetyl-beta-L-altrosamine transaminase [Opitutus sp.]MCS6274292.1 UDP-4-amino-4,6-dideoxy-N-acetyl-beta-L-altrosamine transaminase [Opitutus sp.]MCS6278601.1 UDP-4-amino-4,6-dideoxy-N-acetyl-beta-L-altrosamine transaminase [Opitutus sp.]